MKKKILTIMFKHETNSFCPSPADESAFKNLYYTVGEAIFTEQKGIKNEFGAYLDVLGEREDIELIPTVGLQASPCGPVTKDIYDFVVKEVSRVIEETKPLDGVIVDFHGAMVSEEHPDGEGDLLEIIRSLLGDAVPVVCSLDLHANVTPKMARHATALVPYETYPHIDIYETGLLASNIMADVLDGRVHPAMAYERIPFLLPLTATDTPEMKPLYELCSRLEAIDGVCSARFAHGFFPADIEDMGMSVMVVTNGDESLARKLAKELADAIIQSLPQLRQEYPSLDEALDLASQNENCPLAIGDASDNPGAGGIGDTTHILRRILERGITGAAIATILDPESVKQCVSAGVGSYVELSLGGKSDTMYSGGPVNVKAYVKKITDGKYIFKDKMNQGETANHGTTAVIEVEGNVILVTSFPRQPLDLEVFRSHGIAPEDMKILVAKSTIHYKASYGKVAKKMVSISLPGYATPVPEGYRYKNWKNM